VTGEVGHERGELVAQLGAARLGERGNDADVVQDVGVVRAEQQRTDPAVGVHAQARDDGVGGAGRLDLRHRAPARLVAQVVRLDHDTVDAAALRGVQPLLSLAVVRGLRGDGDRSRRVAEQVGQPAAAHGEGTRGEVVVPDREHVEDDVAGRCLPRQSLDAARRRVQPRRQRREAGAAFDGDDELSPSRTTSPARRPLRRLKGSTAVNSRSLRLSKLTAPSSQKPRQRNPSRFGS
jgi:hypothetical protein